MTIENIQTSFKNATYTLVNKVLPEEKANASEEQLPEENAAIQTGKKSYTQKQWRSFLEDFDEVAEHAREMMRRKHEKQYEQLLEREERARQGVMEDYLEAVQEAKRNQTKETQEYILEQQDKEQEEQNKKFKQQE